MAVRSPVTGSVKIRVQQAASPAGRFRFVVRLLMHAVLDRGEHMSGTDEGPRGSPVGERLDGGVARSRRAGCALPSGSGIEPFSEPMEPLLQVRGRQRGQQRRSGLIEASARRTLQAVRLLVREIEQVPAALPGEEDGP